MFRNMSVAPSLDFNNVHHGNSPELNKVIHHKKVIDNWRQENNQKPNWVPMNPFPLRSIINTFIILKYREPSTDNKSK